MYFSMEAEIKNQTALANGLVCVCLFLICVFDWHIYVFKHELTLLYKERVVLGKFTVVFALIRVAVLYVVFKQR